MIGILPLPLPVQKITIVKVPSIKRIYASSYDFEELYGEVCPLVPFLASLTQARGSSKTRPETLGAGELSARWRRKQAPCGPLRGWPLTATWGLGLMPSMASWTTTATYGSPERQNASSCSRRRHHEASRPS